MSNSLRLITSSLIFICLIVGIVLLFHRPDAPSTHTTRVRPDAYIESVSAIMLDRQGRPKMQLKSPKLIHYAEGDTTYVTLPQLKLYSKSSEPWLVTAEQAIAHQGYSKVDFWEKVIIQRKASLRGAATIIKTHHLLVHPEKQTAQTKELITLTQTHTFIKAIGLFANMETGDINLLSQIKGVYMPDV